MADQTLKIVGIDPSLTSNGFAFPDRSTGIIRPPAKVAGVQRLVYLREATRRTLLQVGAQVVMLENYAFSRANQAHQIGEWGGVLRVLLHEMGLAVVVVQPPALKAYVTGKGNAAKDLMVSEASLLAGRAFTNDEADAYGLAAIGYQFIGQPWHKVAKERLKPLDKLEWPELMLSARAGA